MNKYFLAAIIVLLCFCIAYLVTHLIVRGLYVDALFAVLIVILLLLFFYLKKKGI